MFPIFEKLGGLDVTLGLLQPEAIRDKWPSKFTVKHWKIKRRLPGPVIRRLMSICDDRGIPYEGADFTMTARAKTPAQ